ncbi:MAG: hypothetical protein A2020_05665 [Lentisphaerae bacterium GWF2_45_14]|nr:MAG: hypothetical protein A2020_05665 [Lentisphaerae bacterium GWF2_45_14]
MKSIIMSLLFIAALGVGGFFSYGWYRRSFAENEKTVPAKSPYVAFGRGRIDVDGGIVKLSASKDGVVKEVLVEEGQKVKKGQVLCRMDDIKERLDMTYSRSEYELAMKRLSPLKISLEAALREQERYRKLVQCGVISEQKWDSTTDSAKRIAEEINVAKAQANVALARLRQTEYDVELKTIRAPANGKILRCDSRPGYGISTLNVTVLFLFIPDEPYIARVEIEEKFIKDVKVGAAAEIIPDSDEAKCYTGKVVKIGSYLGPKRQFLDDPQEKNDVRTAECILSVDEKNLILGQRVLVKFKKPQAKPAQR